MGAAALIAGAASSLPAAASAPPPLWRDVAALNIQCLVRGGAGVDADLGRRLCARVRDLAAAGAPVPVATIDLGDPAVLAPDKVTLLVHGSVQPGPAGNLIALSIRPFRNASEPLLFAAAPRAAPLADDRALDAALIAALSETLPWLDIPAGPRRLDD